jgi:hypothetical protein
MIGHRESQYTKTKLNDESGEVEKNILTLAQCAYAEYQSMGYGKRTWSIPRKSDRAWL